MIPEISIGVFGAKTYPPKIGGIETHIYHLTKKIKRMRVRFFIFVGVEKNQSIEESIDEYINIIRVRHSSHRYLLKISMVPPILMKVRKLRDKIDIYHAHDVVFGFFLGILGYHPLIYTAHGCSFLRSDWPFGIKHILKFMEKTIFKKADAIICVDFKTKEIIERYRKKNLFVIPNGVDIEKFKNLAKPLEYKNDKIIIFSAGRMIPSKGFQDLIDAYLMLNEDLKNKAELFISGTGPYLDFLKKKAKLDKRIHILGYVPKIEPYFAYADIFVLPSHYEGFPFTLLEAMAAKTASISTDVGDISQRFKNNKEILIVPPGDVEQLSHSIETLIKDEKLRNTLANHSHKKIKEEYSWDIISKEIYSVYSLFVKRDK